MFCVSLSLSLSLTHTHRLSRAQFDVMVTGNIFGDILSDEASMLMRSRARQTAADRSRPQQNAIEVIRGQ